MELKKNPKADLEKRRGLYLEIGLVVILFACLVAFNIKSSDADETTVFQREAVQEEEEIIIQTQEQELPPPPPPEAPEVTTEFQVVEDVKVIEKKDGKLSLSIKALLDDSGEETAEEEYEIPETESIGTSLGDLLKGIKLG